MSQVPTFSGIGLISIIFVGRRCTEALKICDQHMTTDVEGYGIHLRALGTQLAFIPKCIEPDMS